MAKIKANDKVMVIAGKDKGKSGTVLRVLGRKNRVVVEGVNIVKKHQKANPQKGEQGGIVEKEKSIHCSNVAILKQDTNSADKVKFKVTEDGHKIRVYASTGEQIEL